ncbi:MAG TPA: dihydropteroate synthase [Firmicutes bacterium]|jgi:5-methyltetrahydrofolate--homocysteine methyltransferase|nr:dihydropteroate synthase [Bacillota bacterium]
MDKKLNFDQFLLFDGAMGTLLQAYGMKGGELAESYNLEKPEVIAKIHRAYLAAGAAVITTNTLSANRFKLANTGLSLDAVIRAAVTIARKAAGEQLVALDIGPLGQLMEPYGSLSFDTAYDAFAEQIRYGQEAGADLILIETMSDLYEAKAAVLAAKENSKLPIFCTMTFQEDGRTLTGADPLTMVNVLQNLGVTALGINCSLGPKEMIPLVGQVLKVAQIPVIVQPNAGLPQLIADETVYRITPADFAADGRKMATMGVRILGGCCGTTPEHLKALKEALDGLKPVTTKVPRITAASSATTTVTLGDGIKIIGERINPSGKRRLQEALRQGALDYLLREAVSQKEHGADILDVNVGLPEIDETSVMIQAVKEIQGIVNLPLQIDSVHPEVIEAAVRICNGRPIINSVNGEEKTMAAILPIAKKYGCLVVALTLDEKGIPQTAAERVSIAERIINKAATYGIPKEDIIVDCLVLTASAQQREVQETVKAVRLVKEKLGVKTTLGVSNVSFGLPARHLINRTFLAAALAAGLDAPILNPLDAEMRDTVQAFNVLWNYDPNSKTYINTYSVREKQPPSSPLTQRQDLKKIILAGLKEDAATAVRALLKEVSGMEIVDHYLIPALDLVGERYEKGELFLPQLIQAAETVKRAFAVIKEELCKDNVQAEAIHKGKVVIATVKGDVHDIGKNIVKILLENYGFHVFDLGKDVASAVIIEKVRQEQAPLVGLSALMTTTVKNMAATIQDLRRFCPQVKIMVGGAVLNADYAQKIGADYYGKDAREAVKIAEMVFSSFNGR